MEVMIENICHVSIAAAAELLTTTHLRILMLLKKGELKGCQLDGEWYIEKDSLACLKKHGMQPLEAASCRSSCTASSCGCKE